jgi:hypothetical protein
MAKRKVKIKRLPKGYKMVNGKVVKTMALGGVPRDQANLEAERGETVLTDLDNDGAHELYNIGGKRHSEGGTPLSLPPQSFVFSDTAKMKFSTDELAELGIDSKKKQTPAWASKRFKLNKFIKNMDNEHSDKISDDTSELMLDKNKLQLSKIAFMSEAKKDFLDEEGNINVPLAAYPFLISKGIDPKEFIAKLEEIKAAKEQTQQAPLKGENERNQAMSQQAPSLQDFTGGSQQGPSQEIQQIIAKVIEALQQGMQPEQIMQQLVQLGIPEEQAMALLQKVIQDVQGQQGPPQGGPTHTMPDGTVHPGATHEEYMAMQQGQGMLPQGPPMQGPPQGQIPMAQSGKDFKLEDMVVTDPYQHEKTHIIPDLNFGNTTKDQFISDPYQGQFVKQDTYKINPCEEFGPESKQCWDSKQQSPAWAIDASAAVDNPNVSFDDWMQYQRGFRHQDQANIFSQLSQLDRDDPDFKLKRDEIMREEWNLDNQNWMADQYMRSKFRDRDEIFGEDDLMRRDKTFRDPDKWLKKQGGTVGGNKKPCYECGGHVPKFQGIPGSSEFGRSESESYRIEAACKELKLIRNRILDELRLAEKPGKDGKMQAGMDVILGLHLKLQQADRDIHSCMTASAVKNTGELIGENITGTVRGIGNTIGDAMVPPAKGRIIEERIVQLQEIIRREEEMMSKPWLYDPTPMDLLRLQAVKRELIKLMEQQQNTKNNLKLPLGTYPEALRYGGDPFRTNPLRKFVYGGSLPKFQEGNEHGEDCTQEKEDACHNAAGTTWIVNHLEDNKKACICQCEDENLDWNGVECVNIGGVVVEEDEIDLTHDHDGDGFPDHDAADHVGESHGAKGDVSYMCTDVDANGNCISFEKAHNTHSTFEEVMRHPDFATAVDVWWDVYQDGRKNLSDQGEPFHISDNASLFKEGTKEEMIDNFMLYNQILHDLNEHGLDPGDAGEDFYEHAKSLGYFQNGETEDEVKTMSMNFQGMYRALNIAKRTESTAPLFANIETLPEGEDWGAGSEHRDQWGNPVSGIDAKIGKTSKRQFSSAVNPIEKPDPEPPCPGKPMDFDVEAAKIACEKKNALAVNAEGETQGGVTDAYMWNPNNCECEHAPGDFIPPDRVPMIPWRQDQNNLTNAIMNKSLREDFYPMMEQYNFTPADMLRDDPLSRIHASNSLAQAAIDAGADPYKIFSQAAGENRKAFADVQSRDVAEYNALNKANMTAKQAIDQANMLARKQYVDDINTVGTNRINTEIADNQNIVKQQNALLTNAQNTQAMNQLRANYNVNPQATPWNNQDLIEFANAKAYQDEVGGDGGGASPNMTYAEAFAHAKAPEPDGLGLDNEQANVWAKNYIASNKSTNRRGNFAGGYTAEVKYGGGIDRRSGAALRQWMRGIMK